MRFLSLVTAAALGIAVSGAALADDLKPVQSQSINLGDVAGDAYYTVQPDGYHVVATFVPRDGSRTPMRVQAVLTPGQAMTFSSPRAYGEQPVTFSIKRQDERLIVTKVALTD